MFGYIRPMPGELKVCEFERFKACYCGLCRALGEKYGFTARFILNYELVFLAMLLWKGEVQIDHKRCVAGMCRKKPYCLRNKTLDNCAGYSVILAWWKLRDSIADERFLKSIPYRLAALFLLGAYKKAASEFYAFDSSVRSRLRELTKLETEGILSGDNCSLDELADKFALIISGAVPETASENDRRILSELLYHMGRWIYIIDACDDYKSDIAKGRFNPIARRFPPEGESIPETGLDRLGVTLGHSNNLLCSAFELLPENEWSRTVWNIIYLGMPDICRRVLDGTWQKGRSRRLSKDANVTDKEWS